MEGFFRWGELSVAGIFCGEFSGIRFKPKKVGMVIFVGEGFGGVHLHQLGRCQTTGRIKNTVKILMKFPLKLSYF